MMGFSTATAFAALPLEVGQGELDPGSNLRLLEDPRASFTLDDAIAGLAVDGLAWEQPGVPALGYTNSAWWGSIEVVNRFAAPQTWLLKMKFASLDRLDFWYRDANAQWVQKSAGDTLPFAGRDLDHHAIIFKFEAIPGQIQTLYVRAESKGSVQFPITLTSLQDFQESSKVEYFWIGLYYGILVVGALYILLIWMSTRELLYLHYVVFLLAGGLFSFSFQGLAFQYFWPDNPYWANRSIMSFIALACAAGLQFVRSYVTLKRRDAGLDKAFGGMSLTALVCAVVAIVAPYGFLVLLMNLLVVAIVVLVSLAAHKTARRGYRPARFLLAAWSVLVVGILIEIVQRLGVSLPLLLSYHSVQYSSVLAFVVLSFGLGDRINSLLKDYSLVQQDMLNASQIKIEALQRADDIKEEFIANVSHELRTPLTGIIGLSEIILEKSAAALDDSARENLNMIRISGQRLANLVNDVIDLSSIKNGHLELQKKPVDLKNVCILVNKMCRPLIGNKPIQIAENLPPQPVMVLGDEDRLQQILFNLVSNAVKFTQRGWVAVSVDIVDLEARVTVRDTGIGISRDQQSRIFSRFYQVDAAASREEGGTGLGLSISQKLMELHGTQIIVSSSPGEGSTFYFDLPVMTENEILAASTTIESQSVIASGDRLNAILESAPLGVERRSRRESSELLPGQTEQLPGRRRRILVVDDEFLNVRIVKEHLSGLYEIESALSGHDALMMLRHDKPDLVILDLMMPIMTGFELCQRIREKYSMDELPIIILTAKNRVEDLVKGLSLGANDYISKPFSKEELKVRVGKQLEMLHLLDIRQENQRLVWQLEKYQMAEKNQRERETRLAKMLDVTGDALISIDEGGQIGYINKAAEALLKLPAEDFQDGPLRALSERLERICRGVSAVISFPLNESVISSADDPRYFTFTICQPEEEEDAAVTVRLCVLPLSLDQGLHLLMFQRVLPEHLADEKLLEDASLPQLIDQINRNVERTQVLSEYLARITPEDLHKHRHLFSDLENVDKIIQSLSGALPMDADYEHQYREALVKLMQDCHYHWQKVTGESIIDLAEKSRIWSVSIDNGRLRTRSMNRYLSIEKLPSNPRWRQVARTAYFVLSKVSHDPEAKSALEKSVSRLQNIVEARALT
jgi:signal transduction histidine kinase/DNA-binding NarL/FixJ family response regulator